MVYMTDNFSRVCGGIYRKTSSYMIKLVKGLSKNTDIMISERMYSSSASSEVSSSSSSGMCISTDSRSSSYSFKGAERSDDSFQEKVLIKPSNRRRSTSLIEWKRAPPFRATQFVDGTGNVISNDSFHHATTTCLDNDAPLLEEIKSYRVLPTSASAVNLPSVRSTPDFSSASTTISRTNSTRTNCSCFSCCMQDHISIGTGRSIPSFPRQRRPSTLIFDFQVRDFYDVLEVLGEGSFSTVYLAESLAERGGYAAIKVIQKTDLMKTKKIPEVHKRNKSQDSLLDEGVDEYDDDYDIDEFEDLTWLVDREIKVMKELDHPHIVHLEEVFEDTETACFVMELAKGGEVFDRLIEKESFDEIAASNLVVQVLSAVAHIHEAGIVHRDLKLENLLYYDDTEDSKIMVADFGLSDWEVNLNAGSPVCGTPGYLSPEVIAREACTTASDVWAIGVVAYILLCGYPPFFAEPDEPDTDATILRKILKCQYKFHKRSWNNITDEAKDFISTLLSPDPLKRPTCEQALLMPWLSEREILKQKINAKVKDTEKSDENNEEPKRISKKWSLSEMIAFTFSMLVILSSYGTLVLYIFKVDLGLWSFLLEEWGLVHNETTEIVDSCIEGSLQCWNTIFEKGFNLVSWLLYNFFCSVIYFFI